MNWKAVVGVSMLCITMMTGCEEKKTHSSRSNETVKEKVEMQCPVENMTIICRIGLIVITPDFDNFTAKLIAADKYSKYMTEIPILEGVKNREYYGRSATTIENKCKIEYGTEQGLAALIYGEKG